MNLSGSYVALITPFHPDGSVNFEKLAELCEWHVQNGTDGIVALGTTGESSTMTHEEDDAVIRRVLDTVNGRIPVIAGTGSNCTETAIMKSKAARDMGADGILVITPYYNKANEKGMYRHFADVADAVGLPTILYNVPGRTAARSRPRAWKRSRTIRTSWRSRRPAATFPTPPRSRATSARIFRSFPATMI